MDEIERQIESKAREIVESHTNGGIHTLIEEQARKTDDIKTAIDLLATQSALSNADNVDKIVDEKSEELRNEAEAKKIKAETDRINKEVQKVKAQAEKELVEIEKQIQAKQKEVDQLKAESDKEDAYFERNKEILCYVNVKKKKTMGVMQALMPIAIVVFVIVQVLLSPITFCGLLLENIFGIVGSLCSTVASKGLKIILAILVILIIVAIVGGLIYLGTTYINW